MKKSLLLLAFFSLGLVAYGGVKVTFSVDMSIYQKNGYFSPSTDTVFLSGDFNSWSTSANILARGTGADTAIYTGVDSLSAGAHLYKFLFDHAGTQNWESINNRTTTTGVHDTTLPTVLFNNITGKKYHVWFKVDMTLPLKQSLIAPGHDTVAVTGDFTNWGTGHNLGMRPDTGSGFVLLTKDASDSIYAGICDSLASGRTINFKYIYIASGTVNWESPTINVVGGNRQYFVPEQDSSVFSAFWSDVNPNIQLGSGNINFTCDMSVMTRAGIFNPTVDSVLIPGAFNSWTTSNVASTAMGPNALDDSQYIFTQTFTTTAYGLQGYKYYALQHNPKGNDTIWQQGYEAPLAWGGGNRETYFHAVANQDTTDWYDNVHPDWFIPSGTDLKVNFSVDMTSAMNSSLQAIPFDPAHDTLWWVSEEPAFARTQLWYNPTSGPYSGHPRILQMIKSGSTNVYTGTMTVKDPAFNAFEYIYEWQKGSDASWVTEPTGLGATFLYRVRFVGQDVASHFPKNPWNMPKDTWTNAITKTDQETNPYISATGVKTLSQSSPVTYALSQNYPNPFNPSTKIDFSIKNAGLVTLKIYNILGQVVATLVNTELKAGTYSSVFDASRLSSGVYFYTIHAGDFVQAKKMMLLK